MMKRATTLALIALLVVGCGSDSPAATTDAEDVTPAQTESNTTDAAETTAPSQPDDGDDQPTDSDTGGIVDGSDLDWATVDLTTIDWENLDMTTIDFRAIEENPTAENLSAETIELIQSRIDPGSSTLTIGDQVWEFDDFLCAFGFENTESEVYVLSTNSFGEHADGTRVQMQVEIRDDSGQGVFEGDEVTHRIFIEDIEDFDDPAVHWEMVAPDGISIDGDRIVAEGVFDDRLTPDEEQVPGSFEGQCGTASRR